MNRETAEQIYSDCLATKGVGTCECNYDIYIEECINDKLLSAVGHFSNYRSSGPEAFAFHSFCRKVSTIERLSELLAYTYTNSGIGQGFTRILPNQIIVQIFKRAIPEFLMDQNELNYFQNLPGEIQIFRGGVIFKNQKKWHRNGLSWTTDINTAKFFAQRNYICFGEPAQPTICEAFIKKKDVICYFNGRAESEVICDFGSISKVIYTPVMIETILETT